MLTALTLILGLSCGCTQAAQAPQQTPQQLRVVTTTGILADLVRNVAGNRAHVHSLVPEGGDPHSYEPKLRDVREIVYADAAFTNYLMLEEQRMIKAIDTNLRPGVPNIALAEAAVKYAADVIPLVEDTTLDTIWLGLRVRGTGAEYGATRISDVHLTATHLRGPGELHAYLTGSFGDIEQYFNSADGFDAASGYRDDTVTVPPDTHTHLSWAFTKPGYYRLTLQGKLQVSHSGKPVNIASAELLLAVGVDPYAAPGVRKRTVLDSGHADITLDLDTKKFELVVDHEHGSAAHKESFPIASVIIDVPAKALHQIPGDPSYRFLGKPGTPIYQLPQAVLGKHVHGEIDPHLWQNVKNVMAYVESIRDTLIQVDPAGTASYTKNAASYIKKLEKLDAEVRAAINSIPPSRRTLVTTHDAYGYLASAYGIKIAGFVTPNPASEPSIAERKKLSETIKTLHVPAVFLEPNLAARSSTLQEVAREQGVRVCEIYGDSFTPKVNSYIKMMRTNAHNLASCLGGSPKTNTKES